MSLWHNVRSQSYSQLCDWPFQVLNWTQSECRKSSSSLSSAWAGYFENSNNLPCMLFSLHLCYHVFFIHMSALQYHVIYWCVLVYLTIFSLHRTCFSRIVVLSEVFSYVQNLFNCHMFWIRKYYNNNNNNNNNLRIF